MMSARATANPRNPARREKGEIPMNGRTRILQVAMTIAVLALLAACGGGGVNYTINGGEWPWFWPGRPNFVVGKNVSETVPVAGQGRIRIDAENGEIAITGQPGATSVTVYAVVRVGSNVSRADAEDGLDRVEARVEALPGEILIQTLQPATLDGRQYLVEYTVTVPDDLEVEVAQVNGHVTVDDLGNSLLVTVENGSVYGSVTLPPGGEITLWAGNGDLDLRIPTSTSAELSARVGLGAITWNNLDFTNLVQTSRSLTGTLGAGTGLVDLDTGNGNIVVTGFDG